MNKKEILARIAPCGLACYKCVGFAAGEVQYHSQKTLELLKNFDSYAEKFSKFMPVYNKYPDFKEILKVFSEASCEGCRGGICKFPGCGVAPCIKEKDFNFCYECEEFPCDKMNNDSNLKERWIKMNRRIKEIGLEEYYEETKTKPRYE
ncbi:DUF3795 domain-containing protein [Marinisporobacter balticus]|uniref:Uncharacterized protein DUF3795 n=1 Tax=Marinisporobacter balticus TaxID=2018667 RepID=A0A4R2KXU7_9FIRM|nr:DUF3795 domain-containing protein [Marinisporobacter balticus]TCO79441.1 uncharacterized protein DUF3795 [Marinisporobacter balticus]